MLQDQPHMSSKEGASPAQVAPKRVHAICLPVAGNRSLEVATLGTASVLYAKPVHPDGKP